MKVIVRYGKPDKKIIGKQTYEYLIPVVGEREARRVVYAV